MERIRKAKPRLRCVVTSLEVSNRNGPLEAKVVEELFVRLSKIVVVLIRGQEIRTTLEHPFWVLHKGWTVAWKLTPDDLFISADGQYVPVSGLRHTEDWETVYNLRVADFHTYFVGCDEWGFSVWAHNSCFEFELLLEKHGIKTVDADWAYRRVAPQGENALRDHLANDLKLSQKAVDDAVAMAQNDGFFGVKATFGTATSFDYTETFFKANPSLRGKVVVHHAVEQQVLTRYPGLITEAELHSLENLRGIPNSINSIVHLSDIRIEWNKFYKANPNPTKQQLLDKATEIDRKFGSQFTPPH